MPRVCSVPARSGWGGPGESGVRSAPRGTHIEGQPPVTENDRCMPSRARPPVDTAAWPSHSEPRGEVRARCRGTGSPASYTAVSRTGAPPLGGPAPRRTSPVLLRHILQGGVRSFERYMYALPSPGSLNLCRC